MYPSLFQLYYNLIDNIRNENENALKGISQNGRKRGRYEELELGGSFLKEYGDADIPHDETHSEMDSVDRRVATNQRLDDAKYMVCQGRKVSKVTGFSFRGPELRMKVVYADPEGNHVTNTERVPSRILRVYAPQLIIDFYERLLSLNNDSTEMPIVSGAM
uniref:ChSh domain-containing protein n=1 Tax=Angiostrongylus cantonensis TaxID=6313 RepID=A0A0K0D493_ANGCA